MTKLVSFVVPSAALSLSTTLLQILESESGVLQDITAAFVPIMPRFRVFFFWEQHKTDLKYTRDFIVEESSAAPIIDNTERCGIAADHREMCRFARNNDQGFRIVIAALKRYAHEAPDVVAERCRMAREVLEDERDWQAGELRIQLVSSEYAAAPPAPPPYKEKEIGLSQRTKSLVIKPAWQGQ
jgi:hypothetical protein